jgi:hypothetical protein
LNTIHLQFHLLPLPLRERGKRRKTHIAIFDGSGEIFKGF